MIILTSKKFLIIAGMVLMLLIGIAIGGSTVLTTNPEYSRRIGGSTVLTTNPEYSRRIGNGFKQYNTPEESISENEEENDEIAAGENLPSNSDNDLVNPVRSNPPEADAVPQSERTSNGVKVVRVIDGDTIEIEGGERVRYIGIDAPETVDPRKPVQCFGAEAFNKNKELVEDKMVRLEKDITDRDKYNRLVRYVWVDDVFVNLELIKQGFAYSYSYPPDVKHQDQFLKAQQEAKESERGLWSSCPIVQNQVATPSPAMDQSGSCLIKGNIGASGEKIYHLPGCGSYEKTKIDEGRGEKWFCAESEALATGWRKALNCP